MDNAVEFDEIGRRAMEGDNVAIAIKRLEGGSRYIYRDHVQTVSHTVLEGHRFAIEPIESGREMLSWGLPFGTARRLIQPGEYISNAKILAALAQRSIDFSLPGEPNFDDRLMPYELDEAAFRPGHQVAPHSGERTFLGYPRAETRGVGTRNFIVVLGTTSLTAGFARAMEARMKGAADGHDQIDGIVAVTHTESASTAR